MSETTTGAVNPADAAANVPAAVEDRAALAAVISSLTKAHDDNADRIATLEHRLAGVATAVEDFASRGAAIAETGVLGAPAAAAGGLVQEIVDFLHWMYPVAGVSGAPPVPGVPATPGVPSWHTPAAPPAA